MERVRHPSGVVVLVKAHGCVVHLGYWVEIGPFAGGHGNLRHALTGAFFPVLVHVPSAGQRVVDGCANDSIGGFVLAEGQVPIRREACPGRTTSLSVGDQCHLAVPGADGGHRVGHVNHE